MRTGSLNMTPRELKSFRHTLGLSAEGFSRLAGAATGRTVRKWEAGDNDIPGSVKQLVRLLESLKPSDRSHAIKMLMS